MSRRRHAIPSVFDAVGTLPSHTRRVMGAESADPALPGIELDAATLGRKRVELLDLLRQGPQTGDDLADRVGPSYLHLVRDLRALGYRIEVSDVDIRALGRTYRYSLAAEPKGA